MEQNLVWDNFMDNLEMVLDNVMMICLFHSLPTSTSEKSCTGLPMIYRASQYRNNARLDFLGRCSSTLTVSTSIASATTEFVEVAVATHVHSRLLRVHHLALL